MTGGRQMKNILVAGMILVVGVSAVSGQEIFRLSPNSIKALAYDAQSDNPAAVVATVRIKQALGFDFAYALSFEPGSAGHRLAGPDPAYSLDYELLDTAFQPPRILKSWLEGIYPDDFPTGMFPAGMRNTNIEHPFTVIVPAGSIVPAGTYSGSFTLALYGSPECGVFSVGVLGQWLGLAECRPRRTDADTLYPECQWKRGCHAGRAGCSDHKCRPMDRRRRGTLPADFQHRGL